MFEFLKLKKNFWENNQKHFLFEKIKKLNDFLKNVFEISYTLNNSGV